MSVSQTLASRDVDLSKIQLHDTDPVNPTRAPKALIMGNY